MKKSKGRFIVIEGTDGSGKATQVELLAKYLISKKRDFKLADFPQYDNFSGAFVSKYLRGEYGTANEVGPYRASIFYAVDRYDKSFDIKNWLKEGRVVLSNRYVSANMGHQTGKINGQKNQDLFLDWLNNLEYKIFGIPKPDKTILLFVPPEIGQKMVDQKKERKYINGKKRDMHEADLNHLRKASEAYLYVAKKYNWLIVNCTQDGKMRSKESIHSEIVRKLKL